VRLPVCATIVASLLLTACGAVSKPEPPSVPTGLDSSHVLLAIDYFVHHPALDGVYDPRLVTLTADGTLVLERRDVDAIIGATATKLDAAGLERAWSTIVSSGVFTDGLLDLPGFASQTVTTATNVFRVDDGTRSSLLTIDDLGSEQIYAGDPPIPAAEMRLRASATQLIEDLRSMGDREPWTPPALLVWWRPELPGDSNAEIIRWSTATIDLEAAGHAIEHPLWERCVRLDGDEAAEVTRLARSLPIDHLVEQGGNRYGLVLRPIHEDEIDDVDCP
jgi:hypothetical protein